MRVVLNSPFDYSLLSNACCKKSLRLFSPMFIITYTNIRNVIFFFLKKRLLFIHLHDFGNDKCYASVCPLHTKCVPAPRIVIRHPGSRHLPEGGNVPHHKSICSEVGGLEGCRRNGKKIAITPSVQTHHKQDCEPLGVLGCFKPGSH